MSTNASASIAEIWHEAVAANLRAYRARRQLSQCEVAIQMRALGFTWHQQTLGQVEKGKRRVTADEIIGLAQILETFPAHLLKMD